MRALLQPDPAKRLTVEEALEHPFLTNAFLSVAPDSMPPAIEMKHTVDPKFVQAIDKMIDEEMQERRWEV